MSARLIEVDLSALATDIRNMERLVKEISASSQRMFQQMSELDTTWEGASHEAFRAQTNTDREAMEEMIRYLTQMTESMKYAQKEYQSCENAVRDVINAVRIEGGN